jgi:spore coat protein U-like protein
MALSRLVAVLAFLGAALPAAAQVTTCSASSASLNLGVYESYQPAPPDSSAPFTVNCPRAGGPGNQTVTVSIGPSMNSGGIATRRLKHVSQADTATYNIYRDAARSLVWGDTPGTAQSSTQHLKNNTTVPFVFTLFGRLDALQDVRPGTYTDSLTITVEF